MSTIVRCDLLTVVLVIVLCGLCFNARAQKVRFVTEIMSPFQVNDGQQLTGFAVELVEEIKRRVRIKAKIEVYPWARAYNLALTQPNVFIFTLVKTDERMTQFDWIDEYYTVTDSFYALKSRKDIIINSMSDAKKYVTCIPRDDVGEQRLLKLGFEDTSLKKVAFQSQCLGMLYRDRVDLNLFNAVGIQSLSQKFDVDPGYFRRVFVVSKAIMGLAASKNSDPKLVKAVRKALVQIKKEVAFKQRIEKWFNTGSGKPGGFKLP
ncbi:MAG: transporter substrate-binding domain-containing protein [Algicola sp.]|nr:transporter substrate-binding domain-containing protein [Algicola sp.]